MELQAESATQTITSSAVIEEPKEIIKEVPDSAAETMPDSFKKDFFRQKEIAREVRLEKEELAMKVREYEEKEAERIGDHKKIIDTLKEENTQLRSELSDGEKQKQLDAFNNALIVKATDMGFTKPERVKSFLSDDDKKLLVMDDDHKIDDYGLNRAFDNVKKEWPDLFKPKNVKFADGVPKTNLNEQPPKSAKDMTRAERMAQVRMLTKASKNNN